MLEVHNLVCHRNVSMALICLESLLATSQEKLQLVIHDDGSLTDEDQALIRRELPKALVVSRDQADGELAKPLEAFPTLRQARPKLPHLLKILDVPMLCRGENVSFVDSDVFSSCEPTRDCSKSRSGEAVGAAFFATAGLVTGFDCEIFGLWVLFAPQGV